MSNEIWQVEVGGQVYEASFAELPSWIGEGSLLPEDKVRKGNLRWIEAQRVPALVPFFNAMAKGEPMPVVVSDTNASAGADVQPSSEPPTFGAPPVTAESTNVVPDVVVSIATPAVSVSNASVCVIHPTVESALICNDCGNGFCKSCPKSYGGSVKLCPMCGALCRPMDQVRTAQRQTAMRTEALAEGFGSSDFFNALAYPFKFKTSLFFGALMFMFFTLGQSASAMGGIFMVAASIISYMMANMITFGILANTVENFSQGTLDRNFMPEFDDFSLLDDVVHPFFLCIAAHISAWGPFFATMLIGMYLVMSTVSSQMNTFQSEIERIPGTHYYAGREPVEQSKRVKETVGDISDEHEEAIDEHIGAATTGNANVPVIDDETRQQEELWRQAQESRKAGLEAAFGKTKETREKESSQMISNLLNLAGPIIVIGAITFLWGVFFFPAACAVAGYTRSFMATINPLVGLDTIRRMGGTYAKIIFMGVVLVMGFLVVGTVLEIVFAPFDLPGFANLPAKAIGSLFWYYIWIVFSCIIGYALFKNADKLHLLK